MPQYFENLDIAGIKDALIFLDIDGTLVADNESHPVDLVLKKIKELEKQNVVWLCSNSWNVMRNERIHGITNLPIIKGHRKPSKKILDYALREGSELADANKGRSNHKVKKEDLKRQIIVIGDKILTDGFFAYRTDGKFIKVKRKMGKHRFIVKVYNSVDDIAYIILKHFIKK
ncbi:MAG: hypothetical protein Q8P68_02665 [Candidatus Peregrinibacteria bacterium]|nr:hypothetical protein [Candidatus Peregrinibacteria bacterium]MDZ4245463.1 hypothetical protein [Candidatus Gracilibacteria bacterium]